MDQLLDETRWDHNSLQDQTRRQTHSRTEVSLSVPTILDLVMAQVARTPDHIAVESAHQHLTYAQLDACASHVAGRLRDHGVVPGTLVALCAERSPDLVIGVLAILKAGGAYVPLDVSYPQERLALLLNDSQAPVILTQPHLVAMLPSHTACVVLFDVAMTPATFPYAENLDRPPGPETLAYVLYTSGSTGQPKGVAMPHAPLYNVIAWQIQRPPFQWGARTLQFSPISFDVSFQEIFSTWCSGGTLVLVPDGTRRDPAALLDYIAIQQIERLFLPFVALQRLAEAVSNNPRSLALREVITAGEQVQIGPAIVRMFEQIPDCTLHNQYGPTETHVVTEYTLSGSASCWPALPPIGTAIPNCETYVLNERLQPVGTGDVGDLYLGGACLARGYLHQPDLTAERFVPHPFSTKATARLYKTGDLVRVLPDGILAFVGRSDQQVKIRGYRIEPGEIECALLRHPHIREAVVVARPDHTGSAHLVAYLVIEPDSHVHASAVRRFLADILPDALIPSAVVCLGQLPTTPSGKVDRRALPAPPTTRPDIETTFVAPSTSLEQTIAGIWRTVLNLDQVGTADNFFDLGGHSIHAMQVIVRLGQILQHDVPLYWLFDTPTVAALADRLDSATMSAVAQTPLLQTTVRDEPIPLSFDQMRLWLASQLSPRHPLYVVPLVVRVRGMLQPAVLCAALNEVVRRHEVLRTTFPVVDGTPVQQIEPLDRFVVQHLALNYQPPMTPDEARDTLIQHEIQRPFNLASDVPVRACLVQCAANDFVLIMVFHHIAIDGWSIEILLREIGMLYTALHHQSSASLRPLPIQYADFALWQRAWLQGDLVQSHQEYWYRHLAGGTTLQLPTEDPRPSSLSFRAAQSTVHIPAPLTTALRQLGQQHGCTLFMTVLAAWQIQLAFLSRQDDVAVGAPISNRPHVHLEDLVGFFVNMLVLRTDLSGNPTVPEVLQRVRQVVLDAYDHRHVPFDQLVMALQPERDASQHPLVQVALAWQGSPPQPLYLPGVTVEHMVVPPPMTPLDLELHIWEEAETLEGFMLYRCDRFSQETVARLIEQLRVLLTGMVANPTSHVIDLPLLTPAERHQLIATWNDTQVSYPTHTNVHELVEAQVHRTPLAIAARYSGQAISYQHLNRQANRLARYLRRRGVTPDTLVGVCVDRSLYLPLAFLAILKAGGVYVPLDPSYPPGRLAYMWQDAGLSILLTQAHLATPFAALAPDATILCLDCEQDTIDQEDDVNLESVISPDNLAYAIYTSGSTGTPKGVLLEHRGLVNLAHAQQRIIRPAVRSRILQFSALSFDASVWELVMALTTGATLCLASRDQLLPGRPLWRVLHDQHITIATLPPSVLASLPTDPLPDLQTLIVAGEACAPDLVTRWAPGRRFVNAYGPTETTVCATLGDCQATGQRPPIGRPLDNMQIYLLDAYLRPVPVGVAGEVYIGGVGVARGYLNRPDLTATRFISNPFRSNPTARLYKTGDLARYLPDGQIDYLGRIDQQVKVHGVRIEPGEIEAQLNRHPAVATSTVLAYETDDGQQRLVAYLVPDRDAVTGDLESTLSIPALRHYLQHSLPDPMLPSLFVLLDALPLTPGGKLDRAILPRPDFAQIPHDREFTTPRTPLEQTIAAIWSQVLNVAQVGATDHFFDLGGDSFSASRVMTSLQHVCACNLPIQLLFDTPTVAKLAVAVEHLLHAPDIERFPPSIDWEAETVLDPAIRTVHLPAETRAASPAALLITGATGFLGAFLLADLLRQTQADIYCLVRASSVQAGQQRLERALASYLVWDESLRQRIIAVPGDVTRPWLGLDVEQFDILADCINEIYHCGAQVNLLYPYPLLAATNVHGTRNILHLATTMRLKPVHYISTLGVFSGEPVRTVYEDDVPRDVEYVPDGYSQSKWVTEAVLRQARARGVPVACYRPGLISGHTHTGACQTNDFFWLFMKACLEIQAVPAADLAVRLIPVDYVSAAIVHLSRLPGVPGQTFHLAQPRPVTASFIWDCARDLGYTLEVLPPDVWLERMHKAAQVDHVTAARIVPVLVQTGLNLDMPAGPCDTRHTDAGLAGSTIVCVEMTRTILQKVMMFFQQRGYFPLPASKARSRGD